MRRWTAIPYIPESVRERAVDTPVDVGELTYCLTDRCLQYLDAGGELRFVDLAEVTAALMQTMFAIQDRVTRIYESDKRNVNGDLPLFQKIQATIYKKMWERVRGVSR